MNDSAVVVQILSFMDFTTNIPTMQGLDVESVWWFLRGAGLELLLLWEECCGTQVAQGQGCTRPAGETCWNKLDCF